MKIGITGSNGFIGRRLVVGLRNQGYEIVAGTRENADVTDQEMIDKFVDGVDVVIHLVAYQNPYETSYSKFEKVAVTGTKNVLDAAKKYDKKMLLFSSEVVQRPSNDFYTRSKKAQLELAQNYKNVEIVYPPVVLDLTNKVSWYRLMPGGIMGTIGDGNKTINFVEIGEVIQFVLRYLRLKKHNKLEIQSLSKKDFLKLVHKKVGGFYLPFRIPVWVIRLAAKAFGFTKYKILLDSIIENA